jgi:hypothetical protein
VLVPPRVRPQRRHDTVPPSLAPHYYSFGR